MATMPETGVCQWDDVCRVHPSLAIKRFIAQPNDGRKWKEEREGRKAGRQEGKRTLE